MLITQEAQEGPIATGQKCDTMVRNTKIRAIGKRHLVLRPSLTPKRKQGRDLLLTHTTLKGSLLFHPEASSTFPTFQMGKLKQKRQQEQSCLMQRSQEEAAVRPSTLQTGQQTKLHLALH